MFARFFQKTSSPFISDVAFTKKRPIQLVLDKRQKFVLSVLVLAVSFFFSESITASQDLIIVFILSVMTDVLLYWAMRHDLKDNMMYTLFILPFFYTLSFGLFYLLVPTRILFRLILTLVYGFGLYSLFLSQNIFVVGAMRTIALLTGARIVSFVITLLSYLFLVNTIISLHLFFPVTIVLLFLVSWALCYHSMWTYTLQKTPYRLSIWAGGVSICLAEIAAVLLFWPSSPTVLALFLSCLFYIFTGLSHTWVERRLFRNVIWEFAWILLFGFLFLFLFTTWGK